MIEIRRSRRTRHQATMPYANRRRSGFSLIAVAAILIISSLWASAMMGSMLPTYERIVSMKVQSLARNSAEAGLDYTIGQLNAALQSRTTSTLDAASINTSKTSTLPGNLTGSTGATVVVTVYNEAPSSTALMYDPNIAVLVAQGQIANPFRRIKATATLGGMSKTIQVIVAPIVSNPPYFPFAAFGMSSLNTVGPAAFDSYNVLNTDPIYNNPLYQNSSGNYNLYADIGTNGTMVHNGDAAHPVSIGGSMFAFPPPNSNSATQSANRAAIISQFSKTPPSSAQFPWLQIYDNVYSNTDTTGYWPRGPYPTAVNSWNNVYGWSNPGPPDPDYPLQPGPNGVVSPYATYPTPTAQAAPTAPTGTINLGAVTIKGSAQLNFTSNASAPTGPIGTLSGSSNLNLPPGNYIMNSLTMSGSASIVNNSGQPVNIFVQGSSGANVISVSTGSTINMGAGGQASNMVIYYNGTKTINLYGSEKAILYAPNAPITIGNGSGKPGNFYGSMVGDTINLNGGHNASGGAYVHFDASLRQQNLYALNGAGLGNQVTITGLEAVSWQEQ